MSALHTDENMTEKKAAISNSDDHFVEALLPLQTRLYRYIASLTPNRVDAEDLFQKSLLTAWQERQRFKTDGDLYAWLCGIARNHIRHHYRSVERCREMIDHAIVEQLAIRLENEDRHFQKRQSALTECLYKLPVKQRELIQRFYQSDHSIRDFAISRNTGVEAMYKRLQRIRTALESCIKQAIAVEAVR
ncbi:sigma-70 family RNA polymerase sigma factor [Bremerella alba]|uniref:RNA polymerase sigma-70 region 2 domain-containing protein n=1 Tax=Bremerella alba TaxID=980252 RepID=A0A7V8VA83_9BACT|nr:sigma-70 family RNA polymerase sigma factor [Bremerella alba]MBA2117824.1 hypothetical protein [Bremerella alba]